MQRHTSTQAVIVYFFRKGRPSPLPLRGPKIILHPIRVTERMQIRKHFPQGSNVVEVHLDVNSAAAAKNLLRTLDDQIQKLHAAGYAGMYGITPNPGFLRALKRRGALVENVPKRVHEKGMASYRALTIRHGYPQPGRDWRTQHAVLKFPPQNP